MSRSFNKRTPNPNRTRLSSVSRSSRGNSDRSLVSRSFSLSPFRDSTVKGFYRDFCFTNTALAGTLRCRDPRSEHSLRSVEHPAECSRTSFGREYFLFIIGTEAPPVPGRLDVNPDARNERVEFFPRRNCIGEECT